MIETVRRNRLMKIMSCTSHSTRWILDSCAFVSMVERAGVAVLNFGRPLAPRLQIVVEGVAVQGRARYSWAEQRRPDRFYGRGAAAAVVVAVLPAVAEVAALIRDVDLAVHSSEAAPVVYFAPAPPAVAAERHYQI